MIGSTFSRINVPAIRGLPIPPPPPAEQRRAIQHLDEQTSKIDALLAKSGRVESPIVDAPIGVKRPQGVLVRPGA